MTAQLSHTSNFPTPLSPNNCMIYHKVQCSLPLSSCLQKKMHDTTFVFQWIYDVFIGKKRGFSLVLVFITIITITYTIIAKKLHCKFCLLTQYVVGCNLKRYLVILVFYWWRLHWVWLVKYSVGRRTNLLYTNYLRSLALSLYLLGHLVLVSLNMHESTPKRVPHRGSSSSWKLFWLIHAWH